MTSEEDGRERLRVDFLVMRDRRLALGAPASYLRPEAEPGALPARFLFLTCAPGDYVIRVRATEEVTGARAEPEESFTVAGAAPASR